MLRIPKELADKEVRRLCRILADWYQQDAGVLIDDDEAFELYATAAYRQFSGEASDDQ